MAFLLSVAFAAIAVAVSSPRPNVVIFFGDGTLSSPRIMSLLIKHFLKFSRIVRYIKLDLVLPLRRLCKFKPADR